MLTLTALLRGSARYDRHGVVRLPRAVMSGLGLAEGGVVLLRGARTSAAMAVPAAGDCPPGAVLVDELVLSNLAVRDGEDVAVQAGPRTPAARLTVAAPAAVTTALSPAVLRTALLGKVVTTGDQVSLRPSDLATQPDPAALRASLSAGLGVGWTSQILHVLATEPASPVVVTMGTVVGWQDGAASPSGPARPTTWPATSEAGVVQAGVVQAGVVQAGVVQAGVVQAGVRQAGVRQAGVVQVTSDRARTGPAATGQQPTGQQASPPRRPSLDDLPGLAAQGAALTEWWDLGFHHAELLERLGAAPGMGVLVTGAAGSGTANLVEAVAADLDARVETLWGPALAALAPSAAATQLREALRRATREAPAVVLLVDVEALAPRIGAAPLRAELLAALRLVVGEGRAGVACTTAHPEQVDPGLRAPGVLDHELSIALPDRAVRLRMLEVATRAVPLGEDVDLAAVAARTPGFVAADVRALVREAGVQAAARQRGAARPVVAHEDLLGALELVHASSMEGDGLELAGTTLDDVGDMAEVKAALTEAVLWPLQYPETFERLGVDPPRGLLLYGPPGCGKTFLVRALAGSGQANVLSVKGAELLSKWVGDSERAVRELFRRARDAAPSLVLLDEIDALAPVRGQSSDGGTTDRVVAALLTELDGVEQLRGVVVIGATNRPDLVDPALLRPGRLERLVYAPPPDAEARGLILQAAARGVPLATDIALSAYGPRTEGFSAADCAALVREAALAAMRESMTASTITTAHLDEALQRVRPSLDSAQVADLAAYAERRRSG